MRSLVITTSVFLGQMLLAGAAHAAAPTIVDYDWTAEGKTLCIVFSEAIVPIDEEGGGSSVFDDIRVVGELGVRHVIEAEGEGEYACAEFGGPPLPTDAVLTVDVHDVYDLATETAMVPVDDFELADVAGPSIISALVTGGNELTITYTEPVISTTTEDYRSVYLGGESYRGLTAISGSGTDTILLTFDGDAVDTAFQNGSLSINCPAPESVTDLLGNEMECRSFGIYSDLHSDTVYVNGAYSEEGGAGDHTYGVDAADTIQYAFDLVNHGGTILIDPGTYELDNALYFYGRSVNLVGPGKDAAEPAVIVNYSCQPLLYVYDGGVHVEGLIFEQRNGELEGAYCEGNNDNQNPVIQIALGKSYFRELTDVIITDNEIAGGYRGVYLHGYQGGYPVHGNTISGNEIHDNQFGIEIDDSYNTFSGNDLHDNYYAVLFTNESSECGESCDFVSGNVISDNDIHDNGFAGVWFNSNIHAPDPNIVEGNAITHNGFTGLVVDSGTYGVTVVDNDFTENGYLGAPSGLDIVSNDRIIIRRNRIAGNLVPIGEVFEPYGLSTYAEIVLDVSQNWWGAATGPCLTESCLAGGGDRLWAYSGGSFIFEPYFTDETLEHLSDGSSSTTVDDLAPVRMNVPADAVDPGLDVSGLVGDDLSGEIPEITIDADTEVGQVTVEIPAGTTVTGEEGWDGTIHAPTVQPEDSVDIRRANISGVIEIGFGDVMLTFDRGVRILLAGEAGKRVGYSHGGDVTEIEDECADDTQATGDALPAAGDCKIDVGDDLVVWTKHFSSFVTYTVSAGGGGGGGGGGPISIMLGKPNGGEILVAGSTVDVSWTVVGSFTGMVRLSLSLDGGATYPATFATDLYPLADSYSWTIPNIATTQAKVKAEIILEAGYSVAADESDAAFAVVAPGQTSVMFGLSGTQGDPDFDLGFLRPADLVTPDCVSGTRIKGSGKAVYYCGADGRRHAFPNEKVYFSWFIDWNGITTLTDGDLAKIMLGRNMTYRSGSRLVKIQSDPKVYAVELGTTLRPIPDEATAVLFFGPDWSKVIDDVDVVFFANYKLGEALSKERDYPGHVTLIR